MMKNAILLSLLAQGAWASTGCTYTALNQDPPSLRQTCASGITDYPIPFGTSPYDYAATLDAQVAGRQVTVSTMPAVGAPINPTPPPGANVDLFAVLKAKFQKDLTLWRQYKSAINYGLIPSTDTLAVAASTTAANDFTVNEATMVPLLPMVP